MKIDVTKSLPSFGNIMTILRGSYGVVNSLYCYGLYSITIFFFCSKIVRVQEFALTPSAAAISKFDAGGVD
jgi:hypothetical protein